jgi:hypothetical protein
MTDAAMRATVAAAMITIAAGCAQTKPAPVAEPAPVPATGDGPAAPVDAATTPATPRRWRALRIEVVERATGAAVQRFDVDSGGPVLIAWQPSIAPSIAQAPAPLLAAIDAWAAAPPPPADPAADTAAYAIRMTLDGAAPVRADVQHQPAAMMPIVNAVTALVNAPQIAAPCPAWDGTGDFTVDFWTQDFGVAAGPLGHTRVDSKAGTYGATASEPAPMKSTALIAGEADAVRAAIRAADLGGFKAVFQGKGEGSDLRTIVLTTAAGSCARTFTNQFPAAVDAIGAALTPALRRLPR